MHSRPVGLSRMPFWLARAERAAVPPAERPPLSTFVRPKPAWPSFLLPASWPAPEVFQSQPYPLRASLPSSAVAPAAVASGSDRVWPAAPSTLHPSFSRRPERRLLPAAASDARLPEPV